MRPSRPARSRNRDRSPGGARPICGPIRIGAGDREIPRPEKRKKRPTCFISYAWGERTHEQWVEKPLARDLQNAGIEVILDRWHNTPGRSIVKFIERHQRQ